jgi:hypothetical protein
MSDFIPVNDLDRAIMTLRKSTAAMPDFYRHLSEGELWFAVKYHPELEDGGDVELQNGSPLPFAMLEDGKGHTFVPLFSSDARFDESMKRSNVPDKTFIAAAMPAKQILEILGKMNFHAHVNFGCTTGSMKIPPDLMRDLASGKVLAPLGLHGGKEEDRHMRIVPAADFPTDFVQAAFELLRKHRQFRAAFLLTDLSEVSPAGQPPKYHFGIVMEPEDEVLFHDLNMVLAAASANRYAFDLSLLDAETVLSMFRAGTPFYMATDYQPPASKSI